MTLLFQPTGVHWTTAAARDNWFTSLPGELRAALSQISEVRQLSAGQQVFTRGEASNGIYFVASGTVCISNRMKDGKQIVLAVIECPEWFGEIGIFDLGPRTHDAWVEADAVLTFIPKEAFEKLLAEHPEYWRDFGRLMSQKLRLVYAGIEELALLPPTIRIARRLASMAGGQGALSARSKRVLSISQQRLATMMALSRQTVNQSLKELEDIGAIRCNRGAIEILHVSMLTCENEREDPTTDSAHKPSQS